MRDVKGKSPSDDVDVERYHLMLTKDRPAGC